MADAQIDVAFGAHLGVIANAAQQAVGDARRAAAAARDLFGAIAIHRHAQQFRRSQHDGGQFGHVVMIQAQHQAEASAQRCAHQTLPRGGADGGEVRNGDGMRARAGAGADQNVHAEVFERGVEDLFDVGQQAVNFVDEEDLARRGCW